MLFENMVLLHDEKIVFSIEIDLIRPKKNEVRRILDAIRALDRGVLRIGSSKSSGRLSLQGQATAVVQVAEHATSDTRVSELNELVDLVRNLEPAESALELLEAQS